MRRSSLFVGSNEEERESAFRGRGGSCASASAWRCTCLTACQFPMLSIFLSVTSSLGFGELLRMEVGESRRRRLDIRT